MNGSKLHVQAGIWHNRAVILMEGEARDRFNGGELLVDALYRVVLARGLRLTTDLDHLDPRPVRGWKVWIDADGSLTLDWPRFQPLLHHIPLDLPPGWLPVAHVDGSIRLFAGYGLDIHEDPTGRNGHPLLHLRHAAETGALASGVIPLTN